MLNPQCLLLIKNPAKTEAGLLQQKVLCAYIDGYSSASAELSKHISKMYKNKDDNASIVYHSSLALKKKFDGEYDQLIELLNDIE